MKELKQILKDIEKFAKSANPVDQEYAIKLSAYLRDWLKPKGPTPQDDPGDHPPPPPPHK